MDGDAGRFVDDQQRIVLEQHRGVPAGGTGRVNGTGGALCGTGAPTAPAPSAGCVRPVGPPVTRTGAAAPMR